MATPSTTLCHLPATRQAFPRRVWTRRAAVALTWWMVAILAGGLLGAVAMFGPVRRRRVAQAKRCVVCRRHQRVGAGVAVVLALLTVAGSYLRVSLDRTMVPGCTPAAALASGGAGTGGPDGGAVPAPDTEAGPLADLRNVLTAPASGLALGAASWTGQAQCSLGRPRMTLAFLPHAGNRAGSTVGEVFLTPARPDLTARQARALARHESVHARQWAAATAVGGILLLPVSYVVDESMWPSSANHFEQAAGLHDGGYAPAPSPPAGPRPLAVLGWSLLVLPMFRKRLRLLSRRLLGAAAAAPGRCGRHTRGWRRPR